MFKHTITGLGLMAVMLTGCSRQGEIDSSGGIVQVRSACPNVAIPVHTGDVTLFDPASSTASVAVDVVAFISGLRSSCDDGGDQIVSTASFAVTATRRDVAGPREVVLPYFSAVLRGGNVVTAKRIGQVRISFAPGERRATAVATATSYVDKSAATLPADVRDRITRRRNPGDADAAVDPMALPDVREAISRTTFEMMVGFNLTQDQLRYNATR